MGWQMDPIQTNNPYTSGAGGRFSYRVTNTGPDDAGHEDHIQMWGSDGSKPIDRMEAVVGTQAGGLYGVLIDLPALNPGYYDVSVTLPDGTATGTTVIVQ